MSSTIEGNSVLTPPRSSGGIFHVRRCSMLPRTGMDTTRRSGRHAGSHERGRSSLVVDQACDQEVDVADGLKRAASVRLSHRPGQLCCSARIASRSAYTSATASSEESSFRGTRWRSSRRTREAASRCAAAAMMSSRLLPLPRAASSKVATVDSSSSISTFTSSTSARQGSRSHPPSASRMGTNLASASATSASGSESATTPPPAYSRAVAPSSWAQRSATPSSPLPSASIHPTGPR